MAAGTGVETEKTGETNLPVEIQLVVPGLMPSSKDRPGNLEDKLPEIQKELERRKGLKSLFADVRDHKTKAIFWTAAGGLFIVAVATAAGIELGRKGKDLRELEKLLEQLKEKLNQSARKKTGSESGE